MAFTGMCVAELLSAADTVTGCCRLQLQAGSSSSGAVLTLVPSAAGAAAAAQEGHNVVMVTGEHSTAGR